MGNSEAISPFLRFFLHFLYACGNETCLRLVCKTIVNRLNFEIQHRLYKDENIFDICFWHPLLTHVSCEETYVNDINLGAITSPNGTCICSGFVSMGPRASLRAFRAPLRPRYGAPMRAIPSYTGFTLGDILFCAGITAARRPGGLHDTFMNLKK
jgi:hypothetical protein